MRYTTMVFFVATLSMNGGCAYTTAVRVDPNSNDQDGFIYYDCKPLVVLSGSSVTVQYVKNPNRAYSVRFGAFLSKNDVKLTFDRDCGITKVESNLDTTSIIPLLQKALDKVAPDLKPTAGEAKASVVQIYDVIFDNVGEIIELRPLIKSKNLVKVPVSDG